MGTKNVLLLLPVHRQEAGEEGRKWEQGPPGEGPPLRALSSPPAPGLTTPRTGKLLIVDDL